MKVLHVYKRARPESYGGVETFIDMLCKSAIKHGVESIVLAHTNKGPTRWQKVNGYSIRFAEETCFFASTSFSFQAIKDFRELAKDTDVVHYHFPNPFADFLFLLCRPKAKQVMTYHSDIRRWPLLRWLYAPLMHWFIERVDKIVATSPEYAISSPVLKRHGHKISVIPLGVDEALCKKIDQMELSNYKKSLPKGFVLFLGAFRHYKGLDDLLEAAKLTRAHFVIAGDGDGRERIKGKIKQYNLKNISILGLVTDDQKKALLSLCSALVLPSQNRAEAFGIVLLEGAIFGKPLICCSINTGTTFINKHNETGLVVSPNRPTQLAEAIQFIIDNPQKSREFGVAARQRVMANFSVKNVVDSYSQIYSDLCKS